MLLLISSSLAVVKACVQGHLHAHQHHCLSFVRLQRKSATAGEDWSAFNQPSSWPRQERSRLYGHNDAAAGRPSLLKTTWQQLSQPMYVVQVKRPHTILVSPVH